MKRFLSIFLIILLLIPSTALGEIQLGEVPKADLEFFEEVLRYVERRYPFPIEESSLIQGGLKGMLQSLDPYSNYYTPEEAGRAYGNGFEEFSGIGVYIEEEGGYIKITALMKDQPAEKSGLKKGDLILSVGGVSIKDLGLEKVSPMIKGPAGTEVELEIKRGEEILRFRVRREKISSKAVEYKFLPGDIGYMKINEFTEDLPEEVKRILKIFDNGRIDKLILDLRDNPGGLLYQSIEISELFIPKGPIVHIREKGKALVTHLSSLEKTKYKLVVLVNENTASASEILAGGVKDRKAGALVGTRTYGKGTVQTMMPLTDGSILKLTIAEYLTPNKISINGIGINPDYIIENTGEEDPQLEKAIEILK